MTAISKEVAALLLGSWCIYVYNYFTEVHLGEVNFGEIDYDLWRCHMQDIFRGRTTELRIGICGGLKSEECEISGSKCDPSNCRI